VNESPLRVFIIDEHASVRRALADRLSRTKTVEVVGGSGDAVAAVEEARARKADVVLIEIKRSDGMGLELVRQFTAVSDKAKVLVLTTYPTDWEEKAARRAGARGYLLKDLDPEELIEHILTS
jgi:DNA-binding NarL/FixJ family response regulator